MRPTGAQKLATVEEFRAKVPAVMPKNAFLADKGVGCSQSASSQRIKWCFKPSVTIVTPNTPNEETFDSWLNPVKKKRARKKRKRKRKPKAVLQGGLVPPGRREAMRREVFRRDYP